MSKEEILKAFQQICEQGELANYDEGEAIFESAFLLSDTLQDLQAGEEVIYVDDGTEVRCRFYEYRDEGFTCVLEDLEHKQGLVFIAFINQVKR